MQPRLKSESARWLARAGAVLARGVLTLLILGLVLAGIGAAYQDAAASADRHRYPAPGQLVDVGGFKLHLQCLGAGGPTVILDALSGGFSTDWAWIQPEVARQVRVCAYDRAGFGWSDPDPRPESLTRTVENLHTLLVSANVPGPYVLVGHSKGGLYVREFAALYPDDVAGLVLLDASHPDQYRRYPEWWASDNSFRPWLPALQTLMRLGVGHAYFAAGGEVDFSDLPPRQHAELAAAWASPAYWASQQVAMNAAPDVFRQAHALGALGSLPLMVISAGQGHLPGWDELQAELAGLSTNSAHRIIPAATHASLIFNPDHARQVSAAILDLVSAVQTGRSIADPGNSSYGHSGIE